jgi:integrase
VRSKLNDVILAKLKLSVSGQYCVWDAGLPSFGVRVSTHSKTFVLKKANRYHVLGRYPAVPLKQARDEAKRRIALKYFPQAGISVQAAIELYLEAKRHSQRPTSHYLYSRALTYFPTGKPINQVTLHDIQPVIRGMPPSNANLTHAIFSAFLNWCARNQHIDKNPLQGQLRPHKTKSRDRLLTDDEIRLIWRESYNHDAFGVLVRLLLLTGQRLAQMQHLQIAWMQHDTLVFPASIMKGDTEHVIPLTPLIKQELQQHQSLRHTSSPIKKLRSSLSNVPHWTLHDFRRYVSSTMARLSVPIHVTEQILAHKTSVARSSIEKVYNRHSYHPEMRAALERYHSHLRELLNICEPQ